MFDHQKLREARLEAGMTWEELARRAGTSVRNVARWERGEHDPQEHHIQRLAEVLGVEPSFFVLAETDAERDERVMREVLEHALRHWHRERERVAA